jgi:hypothetical protein
MGLWTFLIDSTTAYISNLCLLRVSLGSLLFAPVGRPCTLGRAADTPR